MLMVNDSADFCLNSEDNGSEYTEKAVTLRKCWGKNLISAFQRLTFNLLHKRATERHANISIFCELLERTLNDLRSSWNFENILNASSLDKIQWLAPYSQECFIPPRRLKLLINADRNYVYVVNLFLVAGIWLIQTPKAKIVFKVFCSNLSSQHNTFEILEKFKKRYNKIISLLWSAQGDRRAFESLMAAVVRDMLLTVLVGYDVLLKMDGGTTMFA